MRNMLSMFKAMAIRTKNHQIIFGIVSPILIFMMNSKNFWIIFISTFFTFFNPTSKLISFSYTRIRRVPIFIINFMFAFFRTILPKFKSFFVCKYFSAMKAIKLNFRFYTRRMITLWRTIASFLPFMSLKEFSTKFTFNILIHKELLCH